MIDLLIFIGIWCGNPANLHIRGSLDKVDVSQCRVKMIDCLGPKPDDAKMKKCALDNNIK